MASNLIFAETSVATTHSNKDAAAPPGITSRTTHEDNAIKEPFKAEIVWRNVALFAIMHSCALYGIYLIFAEKAYMELLISTAYAYIGTIGVTGGAHRLWSHRAYKAKLPLRIFLMLGHTQALQNTIYEWCRDHRAHHKFCDTDADPHNTKRGYFFAHMGWLMCKKHPDLKEKGKQIDMSDLLKDPVVRFQKKYYLILVPICWYIIPTLILRYTLGSSFKLCFYIGVMLRYAVNLHLVWLINSAAHLIGTKPYDKSISPVNSHVLSLVALGECWHNYHHVFPWDYKASELGNFNVTTYFLNLMAIIGQAYDMKTVSEEMLLQRIQRTGDGSHPLHTDSTAGKEFKNTMNSHWTDDDLMEVDSVCAKIIHRKGD